VKLKLKKIKYKSSRNKGIVYPRYDLTLPRGFVEDNGFDEYEFLEVTVKPCVEDSD